MKRRGWELRSRGVGRCVLGPDHLVFVGSAKFLRQVESLYFRPLSVMWRLIRPHLCKRVNVVFGLPFFGGEFLCPHMVEGNPRDTLHSFKRAAGQY